MAGAIAASYRSRWAAWSRRLMVPKPALGVHSRVSMVMTGHPVFGLSWARVSTGHMYLCYYHFHKEVVTCHPSLTTCEKSAATGAGRAPQPAWTTGQPCPLGPLGSVDLSNMTRCRCAVRRRACAPGARTVQIPHACTGYM